MNKPPFDLTPYLGNWNTSASPSTLYYRVEAHRVLLVDSKKGSERDCCTTAETIAELVAEGRAFPCDSEGDRIDPIPEKYRGRWAESLYPADSNAFNSHFIVSIAGIFVVQHDGVVRPAIGQFSEFKYFSSQIDAGIMERCDDKGREISKIDPKYLGEWIGSSETRWEVRNDGIYLRCRRTVGLTGITHAQAADYIDRGVWNRPAPAKAAFTFRQSSTVFIPTINFNPIAPPPTLQAAAWASELKDENEKLRRAKSDLDSLLNASHSCLAAVTRERDSYKVEAQKLQEQLHSVTCERDSLISTRKSLQQLLTTAQESVKKLEAARTHTANTLKYIRRESLDILNAIDTEIPR